MEITNFFGRCEELAQIATWLDEGTRIVSLVGPPGVGKTRLATELIREREAAWAQLGEARDAVDLVRCIASAAGATLSLTGLDEADAGALERALKTAPPLLVLDEAEHLLDRLAPLAARLVGQHPSLQLVVTSRERLRVQGEQVLELAPLDAASAKELFVDRARAVAPDFVGDADVGRLVDALDRLPLALELAAARMNALTPAEALARVTDPALLAQGPRDAPLRHRSIDHAIAASWAQLPATLRPMLAACAVFHAPFSLAAAEAVLGDGALDALQALRDRSLLSRRDGRFTLLRSIRDFAAAQLQEDPDSAEALGRRHASWFVAEGERLAAEVEAGDGQAHRALATIRDDLRAAYDDGARPQALLALDSLLVWEGPPRRHVEALRDQLGNDAELEDVRLRLARALLRGERHDDLAEARGILGAFDEGHAASRPLRDELTHRDGQATAAERHPLDPRRRGWALVRQTQEHMARGEPRLARQRIDELRVVAETSASARLLARAELAAAWLELELDAPDEAGLRLEKARLLARDILDIPLDRELQRAAAWHAALAGEQPSEPDEVAAFVGRRRRCREDDRDESVAWLTAMARASVRSPAVRLAARHLQAELPPLLRAELWDRARDPEARGWAVERRGLGFRPPGGPWQELGAKRQLSRLLGALVAHARGQALTTQRIVEILWPGETLLVEAAAGRVYSAMASLRRAGLRDVVTKDGDGYLLSDDVRVVPGDW